MDNKQEKLILESLHWIINALATKYEPIYNIRQQKSKIEKRLSEIGGFCCECCGSVDITYYQSPLDTVCYWRCKVCDYKNFARLKYGSGQSCLDDIEKQNEKILKEWKKDG